MEFYLWELEKLNEKKRNNHNFVCFDFWRIAMQEKGIIRNGGPEGTGDR